MFLSPVVAIVIFFVVCTLANPDAKRLYDDLLADYNRLIRPVSNHTDKVRPILISFTSATNWH